MTKNIKDEMNDRYELINKLTRKTEQRLQCFPEGRISVKHQGKNTYYYLAGKNIKERMLKEDDSKLLEALLQKSYLEKILKISKQELSALNKVIKHYPSILPEDVYDLLKEDRKLYVKPIVNPIDQYVKSWQETPYNAKPIPEDAPVYKTMRGERVRSKSEMIIADRLYLNGIPYKYECPIKVGDEIIHPDFTILRISDRKILYLEHCGMLDDPKYADDLVRRASLYALEGIVMGDRLFYTFESSKTPLDIRVVEALINNQFR